ncbi:MAG: oligosaccharide flippase family protein [Syntrophales bacterium]|jgi:O-antigen/teichoic acid export membrane protein|nr:oligosaccharide flippase family protein [Syntrophales bacterium]MDX9922920.1 oligosaccharide flippase family protein [Syntrophales bacterium]
MTILKKNIAANFAGSFWQALMAIIFIPLYIKFLGMEAYGLIGIFITLQALFLLLDAGLGATVNREMARLSAIPGKAQEMRDLVRSMEIIYWFIAVAIGLAIMLLSPYIAHYWVKPEQLSSEVVQRVMLIMGLAIAVQWPVSFYSGGLTGLQRQVLLSGVNSIIATLRWCGAVLVLWLVSPTIFTFFVWQIIVSILHVLMMRSFLWRSLPTSFKKSSFRGKLLLGVWRFAVGMSGISILGTLLTQTDKIILSKMLPLETFGYYTLAWMVASTLYRLIGPLFIAVYPRLTQLVSMRDEENTKRIYHKACQFMSVLILPVTAIIAFFSYEILLLWTQNPTTAENAHVLVSILIIGTALNGLMNIPYALQLAHGWTRLAFYVNLVAVTAIVPLTILMAWHYGAVGAAIVWVVLNSGYVLVAIQFMHRRLLISEKRTWYIKDVGFPLVVAFATAGAGRLFVNDSMPQILMIALLMLISGTTLLLTMAITPTTRDFIFGRLAQFRTT